MHSSDRRAWRLGSRPSLDGLRGIACLSVLVGHEVEPLIAAGGVGVAVFFTLSGFLITAMLLEEQATTGRVGLVAFYRRRALRLVPALVTMLFVIGTISYVMAPDLASPAAVAASLFYYSNWVQAFGPLLGGLQHTWSLAVEEQFYLLWPILLIVISRWGRRAVLWFAIVSSIASLVLRVVLDAVGDPPERLYFGFDTRVDGLMVGCALAVFLTGRSESRARPRTATAAVLVTAALCVLCVSSGGAFRYVLMPTVIALGTALVIYCTAQGDFRGWLGSTALRLVGRRSYALYLWSLPLSSLVGAVDVPRPVGATASFVLIWGVAALSWRYVETPFLRMRYQPRGAEARNAEPDEVARRDAL